MWQYAPYTFPLVFAGGFSCILALYVLRSRHSKEALAISLLMLAVGFWSFSYALQLASATASGQLFWNKIQFPAIVSVPVLWFILALYYSGRDRWLTRRTTFLMFVIPLITVILTFTNELHGLIWKSFTVEVIGPVLVESSVRGPWTWVHIGYSHLLVLSGSLLILERLLSSRISLYRAQAAALLFFALVPWAGNVLFLIGFKPLDYLNITPFIFAITCPVLAWGLFRLRLADIVPVALAAIIETINDGVIVLDEQSRVIEANPAAQAFLHVQSSAIIGHRLERVNAGFAEQLNQVAFTAGQEHEIILSGDGGERIYDVRISPLLEGEKSSGRRIIVVRDITERKQVEAQLQHHKDELEEKVRQRTAELSEINERLVKEIAQRRESEERQRTVVDNSLSGIFISQDGILKFVNKKLVQMSEYSEDEVLNSSFERLVHPQDRDLIPEIVKRRFSGEDSTEHYEFRGITKSGRTRWLESFGTKIEYQGRDALLVHVNDITDRREAVDALRESERRYRSLIEEAKDIIYTIDLKTNAISSANSFGEEILGYRREDVIGRHFLTVIATEDHERISRALTDRIQGIKREPNFPFRMRKSDGTFLDVEQNGAVFCDEGNNPSTYLGIARDVTDRKRMEDELRRSEERYRQILNSSNDIIAVANNCEKILFANTAFYACTGTDRSEADQEIFASVHPDDCEMAKQWFGELAHDKPLQNAQYRIINKDGEIRWMESNADSIEWPGIEKALVCVARDITDRKKAEEALRESEERYRTLVNNLLTAVYVLQDGKFQFVNDRVCEMSSFSREELIGMPFVNMIHPDDSEYIEKVVEGRLLGISQQGQSQFRALTRSGEIRWVETHGNQIEFQGRPALLVNLIDITERKRMEEALRESEQKFRSLVEITSDWVWEKDILGRFTYASPKVRDLLGYEPGEIIGRSALDFMVNDEAEQAQKQVRQRALEPKAFAGVENEFIHKNGRIVTLESSGIPFTDSKGRVIGYRGIDRDVTDRKRADEALRVSEERYRSIFEEAPDIFYILDLDTWMILDANKYALETVGYGPESLGKVNVSDIIYPDDLAHAAARMNEMISKNERLSDFPVRILTSTGEIRHIEQRGVLLFEDGQPRYFLGLAHDMTERKLQEEMIRKRNERLTALYEVARAANTSLELDVMFKVVIDVVLRLTRSDGACIYKYDEGSQALVYQASLGLPEKFVKSTDRLKPGRGLHGHVALSKSPLLIHSLPKDGLPNGRPHLSEIGFDSALIVPLLAREKLLGTLTVVRKPGNRYETEDLELMTAIANQIVVAMENAGLYSQILQNEAHLQSILQTSLDGIAVTSEDRKVVYRNNALSTMFGYDENDDVSDTETENYFAPESYPVLQWLRSRLDRGEQIDQIVEFKGKRKDGSVFDVEMRLGYFFEKGKRLDVGVIRDVTERKRMESQLLQSSKLAAIGELAAGVAHEINNPISAIDIQTGLVHDILLDERERMDEGLFNQFEKYLNIVEDQVRRCHLVTDNLLSFSRFPESKKELFDINRLLRRTIEFVTRLSDKKPDIKLHLDKHLPLFYGDPNRLEQVFVNLWNNAVKAVDGKGKIEILTCASENNKIHIEFKDSGTGIPAEIQNRIFDPFFTTHPEGEGTGLGLSISYYIVREMKGSISFESLPGTGTTFTITLAGLAHDEQEKSYYG